MLSWLFVGALLALCGVLGALQYHWIGEVTVAARDRLRGTLQASLVRTSLDFNSEILSACSAILPPSAAIDAKDVQQQVAARYLDWKKNARHAQIFRGVGLAVPLAHSVQLQILDLNSGVFETAEWPSRWAATAAGRGTRDARRQRGNRIRFRHLSGPPAAAADGLSAAASGMGGIR